MLKGLTARVEGMEKVGVCGRTGAGKSSLMVALFRVVEAELQGGDHQGGAIRVDGLDISRVKLPTLRSRLGIIPQEPVLFQDTVRYNLDPHGDHTDAQLWAALEKCRLKAMVEGTPSKLEHMVSEGGENFSVGQRQLMCMTRVLLRTPKVLVLDEATASVDQETDELLQTMIRFAFKDCTVLTIAHRINTILDSTKIMVLDNGKLAEYDTPGVLMEDPQSLFSQLVKASEESKSDTPNNVGSAGGAGGGGGEGRNESAAAASPPIQFKQRPSDIYNDKSVV